MNQAMGTMGNAIGQALETQVSSAMTQIISQMTTELESAMKQMMTNVGTQLQNTLEMQCRLIRQHLQMHFR